MKMIFTTGELIVLAAGVCWLLSLPMLAAGNWLLWIAAQALYFLGVTFIVWRYLARYVRN